MTLPAPAHRRNANTNKNGGTARDEPACCIDEHSDFVESGIAFNCDCCGAEVVGYPAGDSWQACHQCHRNCTLYKACDRWRSGE